MGKPIKLNTAAKTWRSMVESNRALLLRKSGHDVAWWAEQGRAAGLADGAELQLRKGHVSLHSTRQKFAQITRANNSCVDVILRIDAPAEGLLEAVDVREGDSFARRIRLRAGVAIDDDVLAFMAQALHQNS